MSLGTHRFKIFVGCGLLLLVLLLGWAWFGFAGSESASAPPQNDGDDSPRPGGSAKPPVKADAPAQPRLGFADMPTEVAPETPKAWDTMDRAQLQALYDKRRLCVMAAKLQRGALDERTGHQLEAMDKLPADPQERQERLEVYARAFERMDLAKSECHDEAFAPLVDGSMYELALRLADAGDLDAALCYVSGSFPTGTAMLRRPDLRQRYALNAQRLFERNVEAGDWRMVMLGLVAFQTDARWQWKLELPEHPLDSPDMDLTMTMAPKGDALRFYRMSKLAALGAALEPDENRAKASAMMAAYSGRTLTPAQRREADAWANRTFARAFHGRGPGTKHFDSCE